MSTALLPVTTDSPYKTPIRAATRRLQQAHHIHKIVAHTVAQHTTTNSQPPTPPQPIVLPAKRKHDELELQSPSQTRPLHHVPPATHPARLAPSPTQLHTIQQTMAPLTQPELFDILTETQSKSNPHIPSRGLMYPGRLAQRHPFGPTLKQYGTDGCPVHIMDKWGLAQLDAAVAYGAHPSAETPEATAALRAEALEKVEQGFAKLISWKHLRKLILAGHHKHTKISPIAAIPHKSRLFRMILDLSSKGQRNTNTKSVNELTDETAAPYQSMAELGNVIGRFIVLLANADPNQGPILFCKLDIKDGFWRMCVPEDKELEFCYVLPQLPNDSNDDIQLVVPAALQMGWTSSPAFFCAATETGRDLADYLQAQPELPPHPMEHHMVDPIDPSILALPRLEHLLLHTPDGRTKFQHLFEVFVDDFCSALQSTDPAILRHFSRALLHAIHQIFPPPSATGHDGEDPISQKKLILEGEGVWETRKEILGWIFDGINRTMELPPKKADSLRTTITSLLREQPLELKQFESFLGKCQHACFAIPGGKALLAPLYKVVHSATRGKQHSVRIHKDSAQAEALRDLRAMF